MYDVVMLIYIDTVTGTYGNADDIVVARLDDSDLEALEDQPDSVITEAGETILDEWTPTDSWDFFVYEPADI